MGKLQKFFLAFCAFVVIYRLRGKQLRKSQAITSRKAPNGENALKTTDGLVLEKHWFRSKQHARACLIYIHGYALHATFGDFGKIASVFNENGIDVLSVSLRGYGKSQGLRAFVDDISEYLDDIEAAVMEARRATSATIPLFLFGYSMGGGSSVLAVSRRPQIAKELSGLLTQGAWMSAHLYDLKSQQFIAFPSFVTYFLSFIAFLFPRIRIYDNPEESKKFAKLLCSCPKVQAEFLEDPTVYRGGAQLGWLANMLKEWVQIENDWKKFPSDLPVLIMHGTGDCITNHKTSIQMIKSIPTKDKTLNLYEKMGHQLVNEIPEISGGGERVVADMINWITKRSNSYSTSNNINVAGNITSKY